VVIAKLRNVEKFIKRKITLHTLWRIMKTHALDLSVRVGCFWGVWEAKFALHLHKNVLENVQNMAWFFASAATAFSTNPNRQRQQLVAVNMLLQHGIGN